jgi:hypothetical protein
MLVAAIKARWTCEQAHQQLKEALGLDHFEGRSWQGLHRHALMTMIAYAFLQYRRLKAARREKKESTGRRLNRHCPRYAKPSSNSSLGHNRNDARTAKNGFATSSGVSKSAKVVLVTAPRAWSRFSSAAERECKFRVRKQSRVYYIVDHGKHKDSMKVLLHQL